LIYYINKNFATVINNLNTDGIQSYIYALKNLWLRLEKFDQPLPPSFEAEIKNTIQNLKILPLSFKKCFPKFCRLTVNKRLPENNNQRIIETKWLGCKLSDAVKEYGRMNFIGQSILYGTFAIPTAINELKPQIGDIVTISEWSLIEPEKEMIVYPIFWKMAKNAGFFQIVNQYNSLTSRYDKPVKELIDAQVEFIAEIMSKRINHNNLYVITSSIANKIFFNERKEEIEAIIYPSVQDKTRIDNIAIKPNSFWTKYKLNSVKEYQIEVSSDDLKMNILTGYSTEFINGEIIW